MRRWVAAAVVLAACTGGGDDAAEAPADSAPGNRMPVTRDTSPPGAAVPVDTPLVMPPLPRAERGRIVTRSAGSDTLEGSWNVLGGRCAGPDRFLLMSHDGDVGTALMLFPPDSGAPETAYPLRTQDSVPAPRTARLGVHRFAGSDSRAYEGVDGAVTLTEAGERLSGHLSATLVRMMLSDTVLFAARFSAVPVAVLDSAACALPELDTLPSDTLDRL